MLKRIIKKAKGFSLIELATVLVIISISAGTALTFATSKTISERIELTENRMDVIELALAEYARRNAKIPCPANGSLAVTNAAFGTEPAMTDGGAGLMDSCADVGGGRSGNVYGGAVPVRTLGLSDEYMFDGWGRRIMYIMDERFANNRTIHTNCNGTIATTCFEYMPTDISLTDLIDVGTAAGGAEKTSDAIYVLVGYGNNGHGAYPHNGGTRINKASSDTDEEENAYISTAFDNQFVQKEMTAAFDDTVRYKEKSQIISDIGANIEESICDMAENVVDNPNPASNLTCTGATSIANCEALATQIDRICAGLYH